MPSKFKINSALISAVDNSFEFVVPKNLTLFDGISFGSKLPKINFR